MKTKFLLLVLFIVNSTIAQDIIVKKDGTILNVFNLEDSIESYFYTLEKAKDATVFKINKSDVFSLKKNNVESTAIAEDSSTIVDNRQPVTAQISSDIIEKKNNSRRLEMAEEKSALLFCADSRWTYTGL